MQFTLKNDKLQLVVNSLGAEMHSLQTPDGVEYLWQGDPQYWDDQAPNLFPFIGRLTNNSYKCQGKVYTMGIHGFAASQEFSLIEKHNDRLVFELKSSANTRMQYPFDFSLRISYRLQENAVDVSYEVYNLEQTYMPFGIGGHPGFNVPLLDDEDFKDYELEFSCPCQPDRVGFSPSVYLNGKEERFPLRDDRFIDLRHELFDEDAIILKNMAKEVTLRSKLSGKGVSLSYHGFPYLGIWHWPKTDAPYICIEPWSSLPSRQGIVEELSCKSDLIHLASNQIYKVMWLIKVS